MTQPTDVNLLPAGVEYRNLLDDLHDGVYCVDADRRITYWNKAAERLAGYSAADMLNSFCYDNRLRDTDDLGHELCREGCPLQQTLKDGESRTADVHLHHKHGHLVPVNIRCTPIRNEQGQVVGAVEVFSDNSRRLTLLQRIRDLEAEVLIDSLTGLPNRRFVQERLHESLRQKTRYGWAFGIIFFDIDHFKKVNDTHGHEVGDIVLKAVARVLSSDLRSFDLIGRWGGEEFLVICLNVTAEQLTAMANRLRILVEAAVTDADGAAIQVTISGGATLPRPDDTIGSLVERADRLMYASKDAGRNRITYGP